MELLKPNDGRLEIAFRNSEKLLTKFKIDSPDRPIINFSWSAEKISQNI